MKMIGTDQSLGIKGKPGEILEKPSVLFKSVMYSNILLYTKQQHFIQ